MPWPSRKMRNRSGGDSPEIWNLRPIYVACDGPMGPEGNLLLMTLNLGIMHGVEMSGPMVCSVDGEVRICICWCERSINDYCAFLKFLKVSKVALDGDQWKLLEY